MKLEKCLKVYIYNKDNKYVDWIIIDQDPQQIAALIARANPYNKIEITSILDEPVLSTYGNFVDRCIDKELLSELMEYLIPMQMGDNDPYSIKVEFVTADDTDNETIKELILEHCNYCL